MEAIEKHLSAADISDALGIGLTQAYEIIHQCEPLGCVIKMNRTIRVTETGFKAWYAAHQTRDANGEPNMLTMATQAEEMRRKKKRGPGRPRKGERP